LKTEDILNEREKTHGDFDRVANLYNALKMEVTWSLDDKVGEHKITYKHILPIDMILLKLARIICGDPNHPDHWDDIAGYAMLGKGKQVKNGCDCYTVPGTEEFVMCDGHKKARCDELRKMKDTENNAGSATINEPKFYCFLCKAELRYKGFTALKLCDSCVAIQFDKWKKESAEENSASSKMEHVLKEENEQLKEELNEAEARRKDAETYWDTLRQEVQKHVDEALKLTQENMLLKNEIRDLKEENKERKEENRYLSDQVSDFENGPKKYLKDILRNIHLDVASEERLKGFNDCKDMIEMMMHTIDEEAISKMETTEDEWYDAEKCLPIQRRWVSVECENTFGRIEEVEYAMLEIRDENYYWVERFYSDLYNDEGTITMQNKVIKWKYADE